MEDEGQTLYEKYRRIIWIFWAWVVVYLCIGLVAIFGNGTVLYAAHGARNTGRLRYIDDSIKSLAVADLLFGLFAVPSRIILNYKFITRRKLYHKC